jgi:hypothetical protein
MDNQNLSGLLSGRLSKARDGAIAVSVQNGKVLRVTLADWQTKRRT